MLRPCGAATARERRQTRGWSGKSLFDRAGGGSHWIMPSKCRILSSLPGSFLIIDTSPQMNWLVVEGMLVLLKKGTPTTGRAPGTDSSNQDECKW